VFTHRGGETSIWRPRDGPLDSGWDNTGIDLFGTAQKAPYATRMRIFTAYTGLLSVSAP